MYTETAENLESETVKRSSAKRIDHLLAQARPARRRQILKEVYILVSQFQLKSFNAHYTCVILDLSANIHLFYSTESNDDRIEPGSEVYRWIEPLGNEI